MAPRFQYFWGLTNRLLRAVARDGGKRTVDTQNHPLSIGHQGALLRLEGNRRDAQIVLSTLQLAVVGDEQATRPVGERQRT